MPATNERSLGGKVGLFFFCCAAVWMGVFPFFSVQPTTTTNPSPAQPFRTSLSLLSSKTEEPERLSYIFWISVNLSPSIPCFFFSASFLYILVPLSLFFYFFAPVIIFRPFFCFVGLELWTYHTNQWTGKKKIKTRWPTCAKYSSAR